MLSSRYIGQLPMFDGLCLAMQVSVQEESKTLEKQEVRVLAEIA